jgi:Spy/CpxP family protein refolding chaperone
MSPGGGKNRPGNKNKFDNRMKTRTFLMHLLMVGGLFCMAPHQAVAQPAAGAGGPGGMLTQEQRTKIRETLQASQSEMNQLNEKLLAAQKEAVSAALAPKADEKVVRDKINAVVKIQGDIAMLRFKAVKEIASTVTAEQKAQMENNPGMAYNTLLGGGARGGMGAGRRGGTGGGRSY